MYYEQAEHRYKQAKALVNYIEKNRDNYNAMVEYANREWNNLVGLSQRQGISIADQIQMVGNCPYYVANDIATMVNIHKTI